MIVDESMIAYTGNHGGKIHMPSKPIDIGFKFYVLADKSGYALNFFPSFILEEDERQVLNIVKRLTDEYSGKGYYLYMDRYFLNFLTIKILFNNGCSQRHTESRFFDNRCDFE